MTEDQTPDSELPLNGQTPKKTRTSDLISANKALKMLSKHWSGGPATKLRLVDMLVDGQLTAYARYHWTTSKKQIRSQWNYGPPENAIERRRIKRGVLTGSSVLDQDMKLWKWPKNRFHVTHVKRGGKIVRYFYSGVKFKRAAIETLVAEAEASERDQSKGGRPVETLRWEEFWVQMVLLARSGQMEHFDSKRAGAFQKAIFGAYVGADLQQKPLGHDTLTVPLRSLRGALEKAKQEELVGPANLTN